MRYWLGKLLFELGTTLADDGIAIACGSTYKALEWIATATTVALWGFLALWCQAVVLWAILGGAQ